jgi:uroporphyrinogen decarboxylase
MNLRENILNAINHKEIFPIPYDVFENGMYKRLERDLCRHFHLKEGDLEGVLERLGACLRWANPVYIGPPVVEGATIPVGYPHRVAYINIWGTWSGPNSYTDVLMRPLAKAESVSDIHAHQWPDPDWFDYTLVGVPYQQPDKELALVEWASLKSDYVKVIGGWSPIASRVLDLFGMETGLMNLAARPELIHATMGHISDFMEEYYLRLAQAAKGHFEILAFGDDFASQKSMLMSPEKWREYFLPLTRRLFEIAHKNGMKSLFHSCGSIREVFPDLIDAGLDIFEVVQISAKDMDARELKREFGKDLVFYGGMDVQHFMPHGSPEEVREETQRLIDIFGKDGGYICTTCHFMLDDIPVENVLVMNEVARSHIPKYAIQ